MSEQPNNLNQDIVQKNLGRLFRTTTPPEEEKTYNNPKETFEELVRRIPISSNPTINQKFIDLLISEQERFFEEWKNSQYQHVFSIFCGYGYLNPTDFKTKKAVESFLITNLKMNLEEFNNRKENTRADKFELYVYSNGKGKVTRSYY